VRTKYVTTDLLRTAFQFFVCVCFFLSIFHSPFLYLHMPSLYRILISLTIYTTFEIHLAVLALSCPYHENFNIKVAC